MTVSQTDSDLREKELTVVGGNAGALDFVMHMKTDLPHDMYVRWLDILIREDAIGERLYLRRSAIAYRITSELCL